MTGDTVTAEVPSDLNLSVIVCIMQYEEQPM